jgi:hypothetical protein
MDNPQLQAEHEFRYRIHYDPTSGFLNVVHPVVFYNNGIPIEESVKHNSNIILKYTLVWPHVSASALKKKPTSGHGSTYSRTLDCEQLGLRVFYKTSKNFEGILT